MSSALRHIWLCADDYGISPAVSAAIRELVARRLINAASVMVVTPSFSKDEAMALAEAAAARAAIGLHLTLTAPFHPLTSFTPQRDGAFVPLNGMAGPRPPPPLRRVRAGAGSSARCAGGRAAFCRAPPFCVTPH